MDMHQSLFWIICQVFLSLFVYVNYGAAAVKIRTKFVYTGTRAFLECGDHRKAFDTIPESVVWTRSSLGESTREDQLYLYDKTGKQRMNPTLNSYFYDDNNILMLGIKNITLNDEKYIYTCTATGKRLDGREQKVRLSVLDKAKGSLNFKELEYESGAVNSAREHLRADTRLKSGDVLYLTAVASSYRPPPSLAWYRGGSPLAPDDIYIFQTDTLQEKRGSRGYGTATSRLEYKLTSEGSFNISSRAYGPDGTVWGEVTFTVSPGVTGKNPQIDEKEKLEEVTTDKTEFGDKTEQVASDKTVLVACIGAAVGLLLIGMLVWVACRGLRSARRARFSQANKKENIALEDVESQKQPLLEYSHYRQLMEIDQKCSQRFFDMNMKCCDSLSTNVTPQFSHWLHNDVYQIRGPLEGLHMVESVKSGRLVFHYYTVLTIAKLHEHFSLAEQEEAHMIRRQMSGVVYTINPHIDLLQYVDDAHKTRDYLGLSKLAERQLCHPHQFRTSNEKVARVAQPAYRSALAEYGVCARVEFSTRTPTLLKLLVLKSLRSQQQPVTVHFQNYHALRLEGWPTAAKEWRSRLQRHWPSAAQISAVSTSPCFLLRCCGDLDSEDDSRSPNGAAAAAGEPEQLLSLNQWLIESDSDWFVSFAAAEKVLLASLTPEQNLCLFMFRYLYYSTLVDCGPMRLVRGVLPFDIPLTIMFWAFEERPISFWGEDLKKALCFALQKLRDSLSRWDLPHYFLININVLDNCQEMKNLKHHHEEILSTLHEMTADESCDVDDYVNVSQMKAFIALVQDHQLLQNI